MSERNLPADVPEPADKVTLELDMEEAKMLHSCSLPKSVVDKLGVLLEKKREQTLICRYCGHGEGHHRTVAPNTKSCAVIIETVDARGRCSCPVYEPVIAPISNRSHVYR